MNVKQKESYELLKEFVEIANKNNLKYSVFFGTLLGTIRHQGFIPWDDDIDVIIPLETLEFFQTNYPQYIKDNTNGNFLFIPKYTHYEKNCPEATYIDLFVTVPTTQKKLKKFNNWHNKMRYMHSFIYRPTFKIQWGIKALKVLLWFTLIYKKMTFTDAYNILKETEKTNTITAISFPSKKEIKANTFCNIDLYDSVKRKFEDLEVNVPKDYEKILIQNYGNNWKVPNPNWKNNVNLKQTQHLGLYDMYYCCCKDKSKKK